MFARLPVELASWGAYTLVVACIPWPQVLNHQPLVNGHMICQGQFEGSCFLLFVFQGYIMSYWRRISKEDYLGIHDKNDIYGDFFCWKTHICFFERFLCWRLFSHPKVTSRHLGPFQL